MAISSGKREVLTRCTTEKRNSNCGAIASDGITYEGMLKDGVPIEDSEILRFGDGMVIDRIPNEGKVNVGAEIQEWCCQRFSME